LYLFFGGLDCVGHSVAYIAHFVFLRAAVSSRRATDLATHLLNLANLGRWVSSKIYRKLACVYWLYFNCFVFLLF
jgi:hypothetical protein